MENCPGWNAHGPLVFPCTECRRFPTLLAYSHPSVCAHAYWLHGDSPTTDSPRFSGLPYVHIPPSFSPIFFSDFQTSETWTGYIFVWVSASFYHEQNDEGSSVSDLRGSHLWSWCLLDLCSLSSYSSILSPPHLCLCQQTDWVKGVVAERFHNSVTQ